MRGFPGYLALGVFLTSSLCSCATTTGATEGSSETFYNTSEASTKFTSSTSPRSESSSDSEKSKEEAKKEAALRFSREHLASIRSDMAVGQGEYLESLASILEIPGSELGSFCSMSKKQFGLVFPSEETTAEQMLASLQNEVVAQVLR